MVSCCTSSRRCTQNSTVLCYIWPVCCEIWKANKNTCKLKKAYKLYFVYKYCDHDKNLDSHICCPTCALDRKDWHNARHTDICSVHCLEGTKQHLWPILLKDWLLRKPHIKTNALSSTYLPSPFRPMPQSDQIHVRVVGTLVVIQSWVWMAEKWKGVIWTPIEKVKYEIQKNSISYRRLNWMVLHEA